MFRKYKWQYNFNKGDTIGRRLKICTMYCFAVLFIGVDIKIITQVKNFTVFILGMPRHKLAKIYSDTKQTFIYPSRESYSRPDRVMKRMR